MVAVKHFFFVNCLSNAMFISIWKIGSFEKEKKRVAKAALIVVLNIYYCLFFGEKFWKCLPSTFFKWPVLYHFQGELQNSGESKSGLIADELCVKLPDPIC